MDGGKVKAELKDVGDAGQKALQQIEQASQPASKALLAIDAVSHNLQGRVQGLAHEMGPLGSALGALGPYGLAAAAGLAIVTLGLEKSIIEAMQAAITEAVSRLPETATQMQIERTKELAAALYDQTDAQERFNKLQQEGQKLTLETKGAAESYAEKLAKLKELLDAGAISQNVYNLALEKATQDNLAARKDSEAGALRAFQKYRDETADSASAVEKAFTSAMKATDDAIVDLVTSGGQSLKSLDDLAKSIVADITRMVVQKSVTGPLFDAIGGSIGSGGFFGDLFGSIFHEGGVAGETAPQRQVPSYVFAGVPRYHNGGIAGLMPGEIPAILQRSEVVLPKNAGRASTPVNVVMNISTPDAGSFRASQAQIAVEAARGIRRAGRNL